MMPPFSWIFRNAEQQHLHFLSKIDGKSPYLFKWYPHPYLILLYVALGRNGVKWCDSVIEERMSDVPSRSIAKAFEGERLVVGFIISSGFTLCS